MYHNKLFHLGILVFFVAAVVIGLSCNIQGALFITTAKATSLKMPVSDLSVVGKPSLPAATVDMILKDLGSPMSGLGQVVEQASQQTNIDDAFALAVWWTETNDGAAGVGLADRNPGSVRGSVGYPSAFDGYTIYPSYSAAIVYWFTMLKNIYVNRGLDTVYLISHPYVGTSSSPLWAGKVVALMLRYRGEAPPIPIVVPHGKRVAEPSIYVHIIPISTSQMQQIQRQVDTTPKNRSSSGMSQANTTSMFSATTNAVVFFVLLLTLAIVACVFWLEKRSGHSMAKAQACDAMIRVENAQGGQSDDTVLQGENFRIRGKLFLPSTTQNNPAKSGELTSTSATQGRSTGLLSRYGETHQQ
ncbi:MAG: hypothetical protein ACXWOL_05660 [Ktedonobacteraceae bacterium]